MHPKLPETQAARDDDEHLDDNALLDDRLSAALDQGPADNRDLRRLRSLDYEADSLAKDDPLEACMGAVNAGLFRLAGELQDVIDRTLAGGPATVDRIRELAPVVDNCFRAAKLIANFTQLEQRAAQASQPRQDGRPRNPQLVPERVSARDSKRRTGGLIPTRY